MCRDTLGRVNVREELDGLLISLHVEKSDCLVARDRDDLVGGQMEVHRDDFLSLRSDHHLILELLLVKNAETAVHITADNTKTIVADLDSAHCSFELHVHEELTEVKSPYTQVVIIATCNCEGFIDCNRVNRRIVRS